MKIYSVVNREEAKGLVGKYCLFSDRCMDIEDCIIWNIVCCVVTFTRGSK